MSSRILRSFFAFVVIAALAGCSGGSQDTIVTPPPAVRTGSVAVIGTDAPLGSVVGFQITFTGLTFSDGVNTVPAISGPQQIEFARLNGLNTLLALEAVPVGAYTSVTATLATPVISVLDTSVDPPAITTMNGTLTQSGITVNLAQPLVVTDGVVTALILDFRLNDSLQVDLAGQITGNVTPVISIRSISPDHPDAAIDELRGGIVSVNSAAGSFVMQGPHGRTLTVDTDASTLFEPAEEGLATFDADTLVTVSGSLQRSNLRLKATDVTVISRSRFLLGGLLTDVRPALGQPAGEIDLFVRTEIPDVSNSAPGAITTIPFNGDERFLIRHLRLPFAPFLFNNSRLVPGQRLSVAGVLDSSTTPSSLDARRVTLHQQGLVGNLVPGSVNLAGGFFLLDANGLAGRLFGEPVKVYVSPLTRWVGPNLDRLQDLQGAGAIRLRVVGLVLLDAGNSKPVVIARAVAPLPALN